jgi:hypothetical protein
MRWLIESGNCELPRFHIRGVQPRMQITQRFASLDQVLLATLSLEVSRLEHKIDGLSGLVHSLPRYLCRKR